MEEFLVGLGVPESWVSLLYLDLIGRLLLAAVLGGVVGFEREISGKPAGLRTNLLICVGSALFTELSVELADRGDGPGFRSDPGRIAAQVVSGIGFLGAGTILRSRGRVTGLTTAATVWVVAAIGMAVGARALMPALATTVLVVLSLVVLGRVEAYTSPRRFISRRYRLHIDPDPELLRRVEEAFRAEEMRARTESLLKGEERWEATLHVCGPVTRHERVADALLKDPRVLGLRREG